MDYYEFASEIKKISNIDLTDYKEKQMKRRIESLIKRNGHENYDTYLALLRKSKQHLKEFLGYITINVSEFFRNPSQWNILEREIIPELFSRKSRIKIWSSACSTGEEAYSIAMILRNMNFLNRAEIIASDIDVDAIEKAKLGIYFQKNLSNVPSQMINKYFYKEKDKYIIKDEIKSSIKFKIINLLEDTFPSQCDLILCRNVMIYFTEATKEKLYKKFHMALSEKGIFFVGSTEQIIMPQRYGFFNRKNFFYQKIKG